MDVQALAQRVDDDLAVAQERLRAAQDKAAEAQQQVEELQTLRDSFALAVQRYAGSTSPADAPDAKAETKRVRGQRASRSRGEKKAARPRRSAASTDAGTAPTANSNGETSLADACLAALVSFGRAATTNEIGDKLAESGRSIPIERIRSSLGYLERRAQRIKRVGRALWEPQS